jgi:hypothetical protein
MKSKLSCLFLLLAAPLLRAQSTPSLMSYQGRVTDAVGALIGDPSPVNRKVVFRLYAAPSGDNALYAETQTVTISGGEFGVLIGNGAGIAGSPGPDAQASTLKTLSDIINSGTNSSLYLGVTVDDGTTAVDPEIAPRQQMVSGAFALRAKVAETVAGGAVTTTMIGDGQVSTGKIASGAVDSSRILDSTIVSTDIANSAITAAKLDTGTIGLWTPQGSSVYRSSGNVGIGEANPVFPLNFASTLGDKISLFGNSGNHYGFGIQSSVLQIHSVTSSSDIAFGYGNSSSSSSFTETMRVKGNGNVGIGTNAPSEKLSIQDGKLWFTTATTNGDNGGIGGTMANNDFWRIFGAGSDNNGALYIDTYDDANDPIIFRQVAGPPTNGTAYERMRISSNGYLGIGTSSPGAPLHVANTLTYTFNQQSYLANNGAGDWNSDQTAAVSIRADGRINTNAEFNVISDSRIKTDLKVTDSAKDLGTLCAIEVTDYRLKDTIAGGAKPYKKVIAQQLETVFPQAVNQEVGVVPDIFKKAAVENGWVKLATDLKVGEQVSILDDKAKAVHKVLAVREGAFQVGATLAGKQVFVYGREVKDFRTVDYDAISMLNVSATQELSKKLEEKDAVIAALEARLSALEKRVSVK